MNWMICYNSFLSIFHIVLFLHLLHRIKFYEENYDCRFVWNFSCLWLDIQVEQHFERTSWFIGKSHPVDRVYFSLAVLTLTCQRRCQTWKNFVSWHLLCLWNVSCSQTGLSYHIVLAVVRISIKTLSFFDQKVSLKMYAEKVFNSKL